MAQTDVQIINNGLSIISSNRIQRINPPRTPLELFMVDNYAQWREEELTKRRWVFATEDQYTLTLSTTLTGVDRPYVYDLPADCLRPIRDNTTEWKQRGRTLRSAYSTLSIDYVRKADTADFDPLFRGVLAARVAMGSVEFVCQSTTKGQKAEKAYDKAVEAAAAVNAFIIGPEETASDDSSFSWLGARYSGMPA